MGSNYLQQRMERDQAMLNAGLAVGFQKCMDFHEIALNRLYGFGEERQLTIVKEIAVLDTHFSSAFTLGVDADFLQEELDGCLEPIWHEKFSPFKERYPDVRMADYKKARKGWV